MTPRFGYALVHRKGIVAATDDQQKFIYAIYQRKRDAVAVQRQYPHCVVIRVRIEAAGK